MKKSEQTRINNLLDKRLGADKALGKYVSTESSSLLKRFAAESHRERVRGIDKDFNKQSKSN